MSEKRSFTIGNVLFSMLVGGVGAIVIGFWQFGLSTGSNARKLAETAVTQAVTPVCVKRFKADANYEANFAALQKESYSGNRTRLVEKGSWAKFSGNVSATRSVAEACAEALVKG